MLDKAALKAGIKQLVSDMSEKEVDSFDEYATRLSDLIDAFVKTGTVAAGIPVTVNGSATTQTGGTTAAASII